MYPITYRFKRIALANKISAHDDGGNLLFYSHQKMLKLKEKILVYSDEQKTNLIGELNADRVIDFSPILTLTDTQGSVISSAQRKGRASIWRANYAIFDSQGNQVFSIREDNVWAKVGNALFEEIPFLGLLSGYIFSPRYNVFDQNNNTVAIIRKKPAMFESMYELECENPQISDPQSILPAAILAVLTRERQRG